MPGKTTTTIGHGLAKGLGIKLQDPEPGQDEVTRGESVLSIQTTDTFVEQAPTTLEYLQEITPTGTDVVAYFRSLFPFLDWLGHYNWQWLVGDLVAGITIGAVVVPQGMAYAQLAELPPEFGLYSSFMGVVLYWFFATSKDITIGPVAVMSTITGNVVTALAKELPHVPGHVIASALSVLAGSIVLFIGLIRCGWIVDLIPLTSLSTYMTGSALNIAVGQLPGLMGITGFNTRDATYLVFINWLRGLPNTKLDAAIGLTALFLLYFLRWAFNYLSLRFPQHKRIFFFLSTLRTVFVILLYTLVSWLVNMNHRKNPLFKTLGTVPRGFQDAGVPVITQEIASHLVQYLPATVIVILIEHIAISKSFGRVNNYKINPSQEMVAIGIANVFGPFVGGYPSTGSFSRTAIKSKAGVRTPLAGIITGAVVVIAIYALPPVFYYIPNAGLSAVIIHAVGDLITAPNTVYRFWRVSPIEVFIFFTGVIVIVFTTIEDGIYTSICLSAAVLLFRILRTRGRVLGKVKVHSVLGDNIIGDDHSKVVGQYSSLAGENDVAARNVFLPIDHHDGSNPEVEIESPYPGVFIYRFSEGFNYPNATYTLDYLTEYITRHSRQTNFQQYDRSGDRPWNDPGPSKRQLRRLENASPEDKAKAAPPGLDPTQPTLKAIILDFSSVNNVDITSVQQLIDVRNQLDRYAAPDPVDWHCACVTNQWTKRALVSAGFGYPAVRPDGLHHEWRNIFSVAEIGGKDSAAAVAEQDGNLISSHNHNASHWAEADAEKGVQGTAGKTAVEEDITRAAATSEAGSSEEETKVRDWSGAAGHANVLGGRGTRAVAVHGLNRPLFHVDLTSALQSAIANVAARREVRPQEKIVNE